MGKNDDHRCNCKQCRRTRREAGHGHDAPSCGSCGHDPCCCPPPPCPPKPCPPPPCPPPPCPPRCFPPPESKCPEPTCKKGSPCCCPGPVGPQGPRGPGGPPAVLEAFFLEQATTRDLPLAPTSILSLGTNGAARRLAIDAAFSPTNTGTTITDARFWIRVNGVDQLTRATITLPPNASDSGALTFLVDVPAGPATVELIGQASFAGIIIAPGIGGGGAALRVLTLPRP